ncbi:C2H2-type zinc finger transcription factor, partial [Phycomyces blakesleeanus]
MTPFIIPFDILCEISKVLGPEDIGGCSLVCREWNTVFIKILWNSLTIRDEPHLKALCEIVSTPLGQKKKYNYVQGISFSNDVQVDEDQLKTLQKAFSCLDDLSIGYESLSKINLGTNSDWDHWKSLRTLELTVYTGTDGKDIAEFVSILPHLPSIEDLFYQRTNGCGRMCLGDFEKIHAHLPHLKELHIGTELSEISDNEISILETHTPTHSMKEVSLNVDPVDLRWIFYFGSKYPSLTRFIWKDKPDSGSPNIHMDETLGLFRRNPKVYFSNLQYVMLRGNSDNHALHTLFMFLLKQLQSPFTEFNYIAGGEPSFDIQGIFMSEILSRLPDTVDTIELDLEDHPENPVVLLNGLGECPALVSLDITAQNITFDVDMLLDCCQALKYVTLTCDLSISPEASLVGATHCLESVYFQISRISSAVLSRISSRCKNLGRITMHATRVECNPFLTNGSALLDMAGSHLNTFAIGGAKFYAPINDSGESIRIHLIAVTQSDQASSDKNHKRRRLSNGQSSRGIAEVKWFHLARFSESCKTQCTIWELNETEVKYTENYFKSFKAEQEQYVEGPNNPSGLDYLRKEDWKEDLGRGYLDLRVASIRITQ